MSIDEKTLETYSKQIALVREELNSKFLERSDEIDIILTSLVANTNCQFIGSPGTGKSALANAVADLLNCSFFKINLDPDLDPDFVLGSISLKEMRDNDRIMRNTSGKIADGELVFLDEVNKANSAMKNALLLPLNERMIDVGDGSPIKTKIRSVIGASNEYPGCETIDDDTEHLAEDPNWDRWVLRKEVQYIKSDSNFRSLLLNRHTIGRVDKSKAIEMSVIDDLRENIVHVNLDNAVSKLEDLRFQLQQEKITLSDRRWLNLCKIIAARALIRGSKTAEDSDMLILEHALWRSPSEKKITDKIIDTAFPRESATAKFILQEFQTQVSSVINATKNGDKSKGLLPLYLDDGSLSPSKDAHIATITSVKKDLMKKASVSGSMEWTDPEALRMKAEMQNELGKLATLLSEIMTKSFSF